MSCTGSRKPQLALVGAGNWGARYVGAVSTLTDGDLALVCDRDPRVVDRTQLPVKTAFTQRFDDVLASDVDAAIIATPSETHAELATRCLRAGKHVLVEKPMALTSADAARLVSAARIAGRTLLVGHLSLFGAPLAAGLAAVRQGRVGSLTAARAIRTSNGALRNQNSVIWELGPHDVSVALRLFDSVPHTIVAETPDDNIVTPQAAHIELRFGRGTASISLSRRGPAPVRRTEMTGTSAKLTIDELSGAAWLDVGANGHERERVELDVSPTSPLVAQCRHFLHCIVGSASPVSGPTDALAVVTILECAVASARAGGREVPYPRPGADETARGSA